MKPAVTRLGRCPHLLTLVDLSERTSVCETGSADSSCPYGQLDWRRPTREELPALLLAPSGSDAEDVAIESTIRLFSIPPGLAGGFRDIEVDSPKTAVPTERVQSLIGELMGFLGFIDSPMRNTCSVKLQVGPVAEWPTAHRAVAAHTETVSALIGARINVSECRCHVLYHSEIEPANPQRTLAVCVDLFPGEGFFADATNAPPRICSLEGGSGLRILELVPV